MSPRNFSKIYSNPYFATKHYEESQPGQLEKKVEGVLKKILVFLIPIKRFKSK